MTPCNDSHENNSSEPSGRTLRHAFGNKKIDASASFKHSHTVRNVGKGLPTTNSGNWTLSL